MEIILRKKLINIENNVIFYICIVKKIQTIGRKTVEKHLTNSLLITFTNKLAKKLTWHGQYQGIKNMIFIDIIIDHLIYILIKYI